jgi:hypothetical protein
VLPEVDLRAVWNMWHFYGWNFVLWFCGIGLILKFAFLVYLLRLSPSTALLADMAMNVASCSIFAITPAPSVVPPLLLTWVLGVGFDHPINWLLALFCAGLIAAVVESLVLAFGFSHVAWKKAFRLVLLVNLVCVSLAVFPHAAYLGAHPPQANLRPQGGVRWVVPSEKETQTFIPTGGSDSLLWKLANRANDTL